jgi:hypothetical protein
MFGIWSGALGFHLFSFIVNWLLLCLGVINCIVHDLTRRNDVCMFFTWLWFLPSNYYLLYFLALVVVSLFEVQPIC